MNKKQLKQSEKGQGLVEFAASLVVLMILLAGIVDIGRAIFTLFALQDAAEEGMVYGIGFPTDCNQIIERIRGNLTNGLLPEDIEIEVNIQRNDGSYSSCYTIPFNEVWATKIMKIEVRTDFAISMPFLGAFFEDGTIPLRGTSNGVILRPQPPET